MLALIIYFLNPFPGISSATMKKATLMLQLLTWSPSMLLK